MQWNIFRCEGGQSGILCLCLNHIYLKRLSAAALYVHLVQEVLGMQYNGTLASI